MTTLIVLAVLAVALIALVARVRFWAKEGAKLQISGYLPPKPSWFANTVYTGLCRLVAFLFIGPVKIIGKKNGKYNGRLMIASNHQYQFDFSMVSRAVPVGMHYMTVTSELKGIRGVLGAWTGAFGVDPTVPGGAEAAIQGSVTIMVRDPNSRMLIFPQGKLVKDNVLRPEEFKTGAVRIAKQAADKIDGQPLAILPLGVVYKRDPKDASFVHRLLRKVGLKGFRRAFGYANYGATVVVGEPIPVSSLPSDPHEATELLRVKIQALVDEAARN
jgi:1-acyl-sn-glycerol-3-phosphate acyltransferase